jgi:hypothetical protein
MQTHLTAVYSPRGDYSFRVSAMLIALGIIAVVVLIAVSAAQGSQVRR